LRRLTIGVLFEQEKARALLDKLQVRLDLCHGLPMLQRKVDPLLPPLTNVAVKFALYYFSSSALKK
jgi:hypothetical protein